MIDKIIEDALQSTGIPCFYLKREKGTFPCVVYSYVEKPNYSEDNIESSVKYDIYINLYVKDNIAINREKVRVALRDNKFIKQEIRSPLIFNEKDNGDDFYQIIFNYIKTEIIE